MMKNIRDPESSCEGMEIYNMHDSKTVLKIGKRISQDPDQCVYEIEDSNYVVKWSEDIDKEINNYYFLDLIPNLRVPKFRSDYRFGGLPVLLIERLKPLDSKDDPYKVAIDLILNFLIQFHTSGHRCHSDIKPANIMKDRDSNYYLIDFGNLSMTPKHYGYVREAFPPLTSSVAPMAGHITTFKEDLIELGITVNMLLNPDLNDDEIIERFNISIIDEALVKYMEYVRSTENNDPNYFDYDNLIKILSTGKHLTLYERICR